MTLGVSAYDLRGISEAYATIALAGGATTTVPLEPVSASRFEGVFIAPPNTRNVAVQHGIEMIALDDIGQPGSVNAGASSRWPRRRRAG